MKHFQVVISLPILLFVVIACAQLVCGDGSSGEDQMIDFVYRYKRDNHPHPAIVKAGKHETENYKSTDKTTASAEERIYLQQNKAAPAVLHFTSKIEATTTKNHNIKHNLASTKVPDHTTKHGKTSVTTSQDFGDDVTTTEGDRIGTDILNSLGGLKQ